MTDTTTITPEKRKMFREDASFVAAHEKKNLERVGAAEAILCLLDALEQAEAQLAAALQVNATRQAEVTADVLNAMMAGITGQKESVRVEVDGFQCPYCNETSKTIEDATAHDAICPKHPAVIRAEKAEANVERLTKERDWLADKCAMHCHDKDRDDILCSYDSCDISSLTCFGASGCDWKEAARRAAVGEG